MKIIVVIVLSIIISSCTEFRVLGGTGMADDNANGPAWPQDNPIGFVRAELNREFDSGVFIGSMYQHESIIGINDGNGLNYIGAQFGFKLELAK